MRILTLIGSIILNGLGHMLHRFHSTLEACTRLIDLSNTLKNTKATGNSSTCNNTLLYLIGHILELVHGCLIVDLSLINHLDQTHNIILIGCNIIDGEPFLLNTLHDSLLHFRVFSKNLLKSLICCLGLFLSAKDRILDMLNSILNLLNQINDGLANLSKNIILCLGSRLLSTEV